MPSPLPDELRERVVQAYLSGDESFEAVAQRFSVGSASVKRWVRLKRTKGTISAKPHVGRTGHFILSEAQHQFLADTLELLPDSTAPELVRALQEAYGTTVSVPTIKRGRRRLGLTAARD